LGNPLAKYTNNNIQSIGNYTFSSTFSTITSSAYIRGNNAYSTSTTPDYTWWGNDQTGLFHPATNVIGFTTSGTEKVRINASGNVGIGTTTPSKPLVVAASGGIKISQSALADSTNEVVFGDNGQIRSKDNNHRIIFDRANNIIELREYGDLYFSPGAIAGARTQKVTFTSAGDININGASNALQINAVKMLWNNNNASDIFVGNSAGNSTMSGHSNTLMGYNSGKSITTGYSTIAIGSNALTANTTGPHNLGIGSNALISNTTGYPNAAIGTNSLYSNTTGGFNVAVGMDALFYNTNGYDNTALGERALYNNTGERNTACGYQAGINNTTGTNNTYLGYQATANAGTYSNASAIGNGTIVTASNKMFFGNAAVTNIQGQVNFTTYSDGRFKINVNENVKGLEFINKLRPVTYNMDTRALDDFIIQNMSDSAKIEHQAGMDFAPSQAIIHSGFIAQEVEQAAQQVGFQSSIVSAPANSNDPYALSYAEIVVPLVKAVQELNTKADSVMLLVTKQDSTNTFKDEQLQTMQEQINQLRTIINDCCNSRPVRSLQSNDDNSQIPVNDPSKNFKNGMLLYQNKPNPFNNQTTIEYYIPSTCTQASIIIFDMQGKLIKTIPLQQKENGNIKVDAGSLLPGMYMYTLVVDSNEIDTKRMILTE
jgi:trimeric autotransporter adhesin